jgi:hypothetical protein
MLGPIDPKGLKPGWIIVGGESGAGHRTLDTDWPVPLRDFAACNDIPFFFKQWGGVHPKKQGKLLRGIEWCQVPQMTKKPVAMTLTKAGWKPFREWTCQREYDDWLKDGKSKAEANYNRRGTSARIRYWERGGHQEHAACQTLLKKWSTTLGGNERVQYLEPKPGE